MSSTQGLGKFYEFYSFCLYFDTMISEQSRLKFASGKRPRKQATYFTKQNRRARAEYTPKTRNPGNTCTYYSGRHLYCQCNQRTQLTCTSCCCDDTPPPPPYSMLMRVDRVGHEVKKYCQSTLNPGGSGGQLENKLAMHTCTSTSLPVMYWQYFFHAPITP